MDIMAYVLNGLRNINRHFAVKNYASQSIKNLKEFFFSKQHNFLPLCSGFKMHIS